MRRLLLSFVLVCSMGALFSMKASIGKSYPNQFLVSWSEVPGAAHYDLYADGEAMARVDGTVLSHSIGSNEKPLFSNRDYTLIIAARDADNRDLDAIALKGTTGTWSGSYRWTNTTGDDNKGRCTMIHYVLNDRPDGMVIQSELPGLGLQVVSPMPVSDSWTKFEDPSAEVYRANSVIFNTTNFKPSKFKVEAIEQDASGVTDILKTKAMSFTFTTTSYYRLIVDEEGRRCVLFSTKGSGLAATGIFKNPDDRWDGAFCVPEE